MLKLLSITTALALAATTASAADISTANGNQNYVGNSYDNHGIVHNDSHNVNESFNTNINSGNRVYDNSSTAVSNRSENNNRLSNRQGQGQSQGQGQGQSIEGSGNSSSASSVDGGNSSNSYVNNNPRQPVSTAYSAPLVAADDTCMGSTSAGGQGVGFGLSLGSTWTDKDCVRRKNARELYNMGKKKVAINLLCRDADIAEAFAAAGDDSCPRAADVALAYGDDTPSWKTGAYPTGGRRK